MGKCPYLDENKEKGTLLGVYLCHCRLSRSHLKSNELLVRYVCTDPLEHQSCPVYKDEQRYRAKEEE